MEELESYLNESILDPRGFVDLIFISRQHGQLRIIFDESEYTPTENTYTLLVDKHHKIKNVWVN
jgi:hypothetical protein